MIWKRGERPKVAPVWTQPALRDSLGQLSMRVASRRVARVFRKKEAREEKEEEEEEGEEQQGVYFCV